MSPIWISVWFLFLWVYPDQHNHEWLLTSQRDSQNYVVSWLLFICPRRQRLCSLPLSYFLSFFLGYMSHFVQDTVGSLSLKGFLVTSTSLLFLSCLPLVKTLPEIQNTQAGLYLRQWWWLGHSSVFSRGWIKLVSCCKDNLLKRAPN